jgi:hypothetical protein
MQVDSLLAALEQELRNDFHIALAGLLAKAQAQLEGALAEVARERDQGLAEIATQKAELSLEIEAMRTHKEAQEGHVELNIGGYRFETSVQTLRRIPHTFFNAYFSGRYAQDVCRDGSIFVDRDGKHFGHVLEYMRDGVISVAEAGAQPSISLLRALKREFGFYCIELVADQPAQPQLETAYVMGGYDEDDDLLSSMERYDAASGQWSARMPMGTSRAAFGACVIAGEIYVSGGFPKRPEVGVDDVELSSVEKYSPAHDTWSSVASMPSGIATHAAVAVGSTMYVLGGVVDQIFKFDSIQGTWSEPTRAPDIMHLSAVVAVDNDIYVFSKWNSVYKFDTLLEEWSTLASMPHACYKYTASVLSGIVYIVGAGISRKQVMRFDPASAEWSTLASTIKDRRNGASFVLNGILHAAGGNVDSSVERYNVDTDTWTEEANRLERNTNFGAVTIGSSYLAEEQDLFDSLIDKASV